MWPFKKKDNNKENLLGIPKKTKIIKFNISQETVLTNKSIPPQSPDQLKLLKKGQIISGKLQTKAGVISDFTTGMDVAKVVSKDNLFMSNTATAGEITYITNIK